MPIITFSDGSSSYIPDERPETIAEARRIHELNKKGEASVLGDVARQGVRGLQKIGEGLATTATSGVDLLFDTDLTKDVTEYYKSIDVGEAETTAGEITRYMVQFGLPGFGAAGVLSRYGKMGKIKSALGGGLVDGAVATDDVLTLSDTFINKSESDEERLARLEGAEAARARLLDRLEVAAEGATFILGLPLAGRLATSIGGKTIDTLAPAASFAVKAVSPNRKKGELQKTAFESNKGMANFLKKYFTFASERPDDYTAQVMATKTFQVKAAQEAVDATFDTIMSTTQKAITQGTINQTNALALARSIEDFMFPRIRIDFQSPNMKTADKIKEARKLQKQAEQNIKNLENEFINYQSMGLDDGLKISTLLKNNRDIFDTYSQNVLNYSDEGADGFMHLFIPQELREAIAANAGLYGTRAYKAMIDNTYTINPEFQAKAIKEIQETFGVSKVEAENAFSGLLNPGPKNKSGFAFETDQMFLQGLNSDSGILKGRTLTNLPETRRALGEAAGYLQGDWKSALNNTKLTASVTSQRLSALTAKADMFNNLKKLDDIADKTGGVKFLRPKGFFGNDPKTGKPYTEFAMSDPNNIREQIVFKRFNDDAGALAGSYARADVHDSLMAAVSDQTANSNILRKIYTSFLAIKAGSQYGKTVLSPGAQVRNFTSIPFFSLLNGNLGSTGRFVDAVGTSFSGLFDPKKRILKADKINEVIEEGILQRGGANLGEIREVAKIASDEFNVLGKIGKAKDASSMKFFEKAYGMTDDTGRVFGYLNEKERFLQAVLKEPDSFIPIDAAKNLVKFSDLIEAGKGGAKIKPSAIINKYGEEGLESFVRGEMGEVAANTIQNYKRVVPGVGVVIRKSPLGNFVAFPAEIMRNTTNAVSRGIKELASDNKELQKIGMRRLTGAMVTTTTLPTALVGLGSALTGVTKEKIDAYKRSFAAPWDRTASLIPIASDKDGNPTQFINFSYMNPYDYLKRPVTRVFQEVANGNRDEESLQKILLDGTFGAVQEIFQPFAEPAFSAQAILEATNGETRTGKKIWGVSDNFGDRVAKSMYYISDQILPTITPFRIQADISNKGPLGVSRPEMVSKNFPRAVFGSTNKQGEDKITDRMGNVIDVEETLMQAFTGLKVVKPQVDRSMLYRGFEANDAIRDATNTFNSLLRNNDPKTAEELLQGYMFQNENRFKALRDLYTAIEDARALGMSERQIEQKLKDAKVANYEMVMRGIFKPITVSPELLRQAQERGTDINPTALPVAEQRLRQDLEGAFINPLQIERSRASQVLREEEMDKLTGGT